MPESSPTPNRKPRERNRVGASIEGQVADSGALAGGLDVQLSRYLIDESPVGVVATDALGNVTSMNPAALAIVGSPGEAVSLQFNVLTLPSTIESGIAETYLRVIEGKRLHRIETSFTSVWGKTSKVSMQVVPMLDGEGNVTGTLGIIEDVTERAAAQDALLASEMRLRKIVTGALDAFVAMDRDGNITEWTPRAEEMFGWRADEVIGRAVAETIIPPRRRVAHRGGLQRYLESGEATILDRRIEVEAQHQDGHVFPVELSVIANSSGDAFAAFVRDISERREAEALLSEREESFRLLFASNPHPMWVYDRETLAFVEVNDAAVDAYGFSRDEFLSMSIADIRPPEDVPALRGLADELADGADRRAERRHRKKDGSVFDVVVTSHGMRFGGRSAILVVAEDVTDRKRAESALRTSVAETRAILRAIPDLMVRVGRDGILRDVHVPEGVDWAPPPEQMVGRNIADAAPSRAPFAPSTIRAAFDTGELQTREFDMETAAGVRSLEVRVSVSGGDEAIIMTRDVTDRKRAESALVRELEFRQLVMESATNAIAALDLTGRFTLVNHRMCELTGYSEAEMVGFDVRGLLPPDKLGPVVAELQGMLAQGIRVTQYETQILRKDGTRRLIEFSMGPLMEGGVITGVAGTAEDVTDKRRLEDQYLQSQKMESIGRLAGGLAHDMSNMMTAIIVNAELDLMSMPSEALLREDLQEIRDTATRAAELSQQLLAFSRRQMVVPQIVGLNDIIFSTERLLRRLIGEDVEMSFKADPDAGLVKVDQSQFEQVLVNLVVNARDAMPEGGSILLETRHVELDESHASDRGEIGRGRYAVLSVTDTGHGMSPEVQQHLFEPFYTTKEVGRGTGLGLATVYGIVKQAGGHIWVYSEAGKGSTFRIYLPHVEGSPQPEVVSVAPAMATGDETVLLVEDETSVRRPAARLLRQLGYKVIEAADGEDALRLCTDADGGVDVVVTDVVMPRMGGSELAQRLGETHPDLRVLFMSGYTEDALVRSKVVDHTISFLQKPFTPALLAQRVRDLLDAPRG